ncbi:MAG: serine hydrolase [Sphingomonas sp.]
MAPRALATRLGALAQGFDGDVGIAVTDVRSGWTIGAGATGLFPQQSVSKLWVALTVFDAIDRGAMRLDQPVIVRREDLVVFHQPLAALIGPDGHATTVSALLERALTTSDNLANDKLLTLAGGPSAVRAMLARHGLDGIRFGPGERLLQAGTAGLAWRQDYAVNGGFLRARAALPMETRRAALERYLADPVDGASPAGITRALSRLAKGDLLSPESTRRMLALMAASRTGPGRLRGGLTPGWALAHKTGTGQELGAVATGYNDVGLLTGPGGRRYGVAVLIGRTTRPIPVRQRLMIEVMRAVIAAG